MIAMSRGLGQDNSGFASQAELNVNLQRRLPMELCGPYACEDADFRLVCCWLRIGHAKVAVQLPTEVLRDPQLHDRGEIVLHVPNERPVAVDPQAILTAKQQQQVRGWAAEMVDFDRF